MASLTTPSVGNSESKDSRAATDPPPSSTRKRATAVSAAGTSEASLPTLGRSASQELLRMRVSHDSDELQCRARGGEPPAAAARCRALYLAPSWPSHRRRAPSPCRLLHEVYKWVPGREQVRPRAEVRAQKELLLTNLQQMWASRHDWVFHHVFGCATRRGPDGKRACPTPPAPGSTVFARNPYPYDVPEGTEHCLLWMASPEAEWPEERVTARLAEAVDERGGGAFVWYANPKMSLDNPNMYHVQVFWRPAVPQPP